MNNQHAQIAPHELARRVPFDSLDKFAASLFDTQVMPVVRQVDAALFAFSSLLSQGVILADEAGQHRRCLALLHQPPLGAALYPALPGAASSDAKGHI